MKMLDNIKIGTKLIAGFVVVAAIAAATGLVGIQKIKLIDTEYTRLYERMTVPLGDLLEIGVAFQRIRVNLRDVILADSAAEGQVFAAKLAELDKQMDAAAAKYEATIVSDAMKGAFADYKSGETAFTPFRAEIIRLAQAGKKDEAMKLMRGDALVTAKIVEGAIDKMAELKVADAKVISDTNTALANAAVTFMSILIACGALLGLGLGFVLARSITGPLTRGVNMLQEMARGHLGLRLKMDRKDEIGVLAGAMDGFADDLQVNVVGTMQKVAAGDLSMNIVAKDAQDEISPALIKTIDSLRGLLAQTNVLVKATVEGRLATRGDVSKVQGGYREIVEGVNSLCDAFVGPINVTAEYVDRISKGDIPPKITDTYQGDFNEIKNNLNACIDTMSGLLTETDKLVNATVAGKLATRGDAAKFAGGWGKLVGGVNNLCDAFVGPINVTAEYVDRISKGDIPPKITDTYQGDFNEIKNNLNACIDTMSGLLTETDKLVNATVAGKLATRGDAAKFAGGWGKLVGGVNNLCDAFVGPINVTAEYVDRISKGDIPPKITDTYQGDFNEIKNNLNACIDTMSGLLVETDMLVSATVAGKLATRGDAAKFAGGWGKLVGGVNNLCDAFVGPINVTAEYVDRISKGDIPPKITDTYQGDFNAIKNNLNSCIETMSGLLVESDKLVAATVAGKLATRADAAKFQGGWNQLMGGINNLCDAFVGPINVTAEYVDRISKGDIPSKITDSYQGDFNKIKNNLNACIDAVGALVADAGLLVDAAVGGHLKTRADATKHQGDFRKVVEGVNRTLDAVNTPIEEAGKVLAQIALQDLRVSVKGDYAGDHAAIKNSINTMVSDLRQNILQITQNAQSLGSSAEELTAISQQMAGNAEETSTQTNVVSAASEQVSRNLTVVATSSEEMLASIREIAKSSNEAARMAKNAVVVADATNQTVQKLGDASVEIGNVIKVITSIAEQTNLLALNATIEAARAGDAGKGFAVVANEVKELAKETAKATEDISRKIEAIQTETQGAVHAIGQISTLIGQIDSVSNTIASAVEEQTATTNEIGRNLAEAVKGSGEIAQNISGVALAAQSTTSGASDTQRAAKALSEMAGQLQTLVGRFAA